MRCPDCGKTMHIVNKQIDGKLTDIPASPLRYVCMCGKLVMAEVQH
jgi:hypothetical protein